MSIQPIPPTTAQTTAGQLATRATQNDQTLAARIASTEAAVGELESRSGTLVTEPTPGVARIHNPITGIGKFVLAVGAQGQLPAHVFAQLELPDANIIAQMQALLDDYQAGQDATDTAMSSVIENGPLTQEALRDATAAQTRTLSAATHGAHIEASWQVNRDAINAAISQASVLGGGTVVLPPGTYTAKGIVLDHGVHLDLTGVTIISPDGTVPDVITTRQRHRPGVNATSRTLVVPDTEGVKVGAVVAVQYAGGLLDSQTTTLTSSITASQTTGITLAATTGLASAGVLQVGTELIRYTGHSGGALSGVTRGVHGTTATTHSSGAQVAPARRHYALVQRVVGDVITLDKSVALPVTGVEASFGVVGAGVVGRGLVDAKKVLPNGAALSVYGVSGPMVRAATFDVRVQNGDQGGFILSRGASDNNVPYVGLHDCGLPGISKGSSFWLYQACKRNRIGQVVVTGEAWTAVYLDDRTTTNEEGWDAPNVGNTFDYTHIDIQSGGFAPALSIVSGDDNVFHAGFLSTTAVGYAVAAGSQGLGSPKPLRNKFGNFTIKATQALLMHASAQDGGNIVHDVYVTADTLDVGLTSFSLGNLQYAVSPSPGAVPNIPLRGNMSGSGSPAFSFTGDSNTGLYSDAPDVVGLSAGAVPAIRAMTTETRFYGPNMKLRSTGLWQLPVAEDGVPAPADTGHLYFRKNASGKVQLVARFPTGFPKVISTED